MLIAINKQSKTKKFLEKRDYGADAYTDSDWLWLKEAAKEEWECPFCGCEMQLVSFHKENLNTPHWRAKNKHTDPMCDYIEKGLDKNPLSRFKFLEKLYKTKKYAAIVDMSVMSIDDLKDGIYEGAVLKVKRHEMKVIKISEVHGVRYATVNIGNPFKDGISLRILENDLPKADQEMVICVSRINEKTGIGRFGSWILRCCDNIGFKSFIKR